MGTSVYNTKTKQRAHGKKRKSAWQSPLDRAAVHEVAWEQVAPLFEIARGIANICFVYYVGEEDGGPVKIGSAKDPISRLRGLQTGNPRRLRVEYVLIGRLNLERLLQEMWQSFAIRSKRGQKFDAPPGTEWFKSEMRAQIEPILKTAAKRQVQFIERFEAGPDFGPDSVLSEESLDKIVRGAHGEHDFVAQRRDEVRLLSASGAGYVHPRKIRI